MSTCNILDNVAKQFASIFGESKRLIYAQASVSGIGLVPGRNIFLAISWQFLGNFLCNPKLTLRKLHPIYHSWFMVSKEILCKPKPLKLKSLSSFSLMATFLIFTIITPLSQGGAIMNISESQVIVHTELQSSYIPLSYRRKALGRDRNSCQFCGKQTEMLCHDLPKCRGGKTEAVNLLVCCQDCRREKGEFTAKEYRAVRLEHIDFPREVKSMRIKVVFASGWEVEGIVDMLPKPEDKAFYLRYDGNGGRELIFTEPGMRIVEMGGEK